MPCKVAAGGRAFIPLLFTLCSPGIYHFYEGAGHGRVVSKGREGDAVGGGDARKEAEASGKVVHETVD